MGPACPVPSPRVLHTPGTAGPQTCILRPPPRLPTQRSLYLVYRPFFRQKEFLTESLRLLSSRAGKLLSSKLIISPWPRAPDLALFPGWAVGAGETASSHSGRPFRPVASSLPPGSLVRGKTKPHHGDCVQGPRAAPPIRAGASLGERERPAPSTLPQGEAGPRESRPAGGAWCQLTRVGLLGILLALAPDDEHEYQQQDEDEADEGNDHQEPPLLVERVGFLSWDTDGGVKSRVLSPLLPPNLPLQPGPHHLALSRPGACRLRGGDPKTRSTGTVLAQVPALFCCWSKDAFSSEVLLDSLGESARVGID